MGKQRVTTTKSCRDCGQVFPLEDFPLDGWQANGTQQYKARCVPCNRVHRRNEYPYSRDGLPEVLHSERPARPIEPRVDQYRIACVACAYEVFTGLTKARMRLLSTACVRCGRCRGPVEFEVVTDWGVRTSMLAAHSTTHQPGMAHAWRESMA